MKDALELVVIAEEEAFNLPDEDERRFEELQKELLDPVYLQDVLQDLELHELIVTCPVSDKVRLECEREMQIGARTGWRLN